MYNFLFEERLHQARTDRAHGSGQIVKEYLLLCSMVGGGQTIIIGEGHDVVFPLPVTILDMEVLCVGIFLGKPCN
jgi:hypothetical protein